MGFIGYLMDFRVDFCRKISGTFWKIELNVLQIIKPINIDVDNREKLKFEILLIINSKLENKPEN